MRWPSFANRRLSSSTGSPLLPPWRPRDRTLSSRTCAVLGPCVLSNSPVNNFRFIRLLLRAAPLVCDVNSILLKPAVRMFDFQAMLASSAVALSKLCESADVEASVVAIEQALEGLTGVAVLLNSASSATAANLASQQQATPFFAQSTIGCRYDNSRSVQLTCASWFFRLTGCCLASGGGARAHRRAVACAR